MDQVEGTACKKSMEAVGARYIQGRRTYTQAHARSKRFKRKECEKLVGEDPKMP